MDDLREQVELLERDANLSTSINDVQNAIDMLTAARAKIAAGEPIYRKRSGCVPILIRRRADPRTAALTLARLQTPFKETMDTALKDIKPIYAGLNKYGKLLDKVSFPPQLFDLRQTLTVYAEIQRQAAPLGRKRCSIVTSLSD